MPKLPYKVKALNVTLPAEYVEVIEQVAKRFGKSKSYVAQCYLKPHIDVAIALFQGSDDREPFVRLADERGAKDDDSPSDPGDTLTTGLLLGAIQREESPLH
jgi:hypothetical protein